MKAQIIIVMADDNGIQVAAQYHKSGDQASYTVEMGDTDENQIELLRKVLSTGRAQDLTQTAIPNFGQVQ